MPIAKVQLPDGRVAKLEVPEGTTEKQVVEAATNMFSGRSEAIVADPQPMPETVLRTTPVNVNDVPQTTQPLPEDQTIINGEDLGSEPVKQYPQMYPSHATPGQIGQTLSGIGNLGLKMVQNTPESAANLVNNIGLALMHPLDTWKALSQVAFGGAEKLIPGEQVDEEAFNAVTDFFKERYGSLENLNKTMEEDPVGVMADMSALLSGGGGLASKLPGAAGRTGETIAALGKATEPLNLAAEASGAAIRGAQTAVGKVAPEVLGTVTGAGPEAIRQAIKGEGLTSDTSNFVAGLRGKVGREELLSESKSALHSVKADRGAAYRQKLSEIAKNKTPIDLRPIKLKMGELMKRYNIKVTKDGSLDFSRSALNKNSIGEVEEIINKVSEWGTQQGDNTAIGLDVLKRQLDDFFSESKNSRALVTEMRNNVKSQIVKEVPEYAEMTKDYEKLTRITNEIEKALSLSDRVMADTAIKKLISANRENFEFRKQLVSKLEELSGEEGIMPTAAGITMNQMVPKGLVGKLAVGGGAVATQLDPMFLALATIASPRVMGELLNTMGYGKNQLGKIMSAASSARAGSTGVRQVAAQAGQTKEQTK